MAVNALPTTASDVSDVAARPRDQPEGQIPGAPRAEPWGKARIPPRKAKRFFARRIGTMCKAFPDNRALLKLAVALGSPFAAAFLQWQIWPLIKPLAWFLFFPAMFIASWAGNRLVAFFSSVVSVGLVWRLFLQADHPIHNSTGAYLSTAVFLGLCALFSQFQHRLRLANGKAASLLAEAHAANADLAHSRKLLTDLIELAPDGIFIADQTGRYRDVNSAGCRMLGYSRHDLLQKSIMDLIPAEDVPRLWEVQARLRDGGMDLGEWRMIRGDGASITCEVSTTILPDGRWQALVRDTSARRNAEAELKRAAIVYRNTNEGIIVTDANANIISVNPAFESMSGYGRSEVIGLNPRFQKSGRQDSSFYQSIWNALQATGQWQGELWNRRKDGTVYPVWQNISAVRDEHGIITNYVSVLADISAIKGAEARLAHLAHHDALTGLPNRLQLDSALQASLDRARHCAGKLAVLFVDLDNFKLVNDSLGHAAGDRLLREAGARIVQCVRAKDTVARVSGDEFTVLLEDIAGSADASAIAQKIVMALREPVELPERTVTSSASVGISVFPDDGLTAEELVRNADAALYRAKELGRNAYLFYSPELTVRAARRLSLEHNLRRALAHDEFVLHYQPQFDARSGSFTGMEALLRWQSPTLGLVLPEHFIHVAEESQLIEAIGDWVINQACRQARSWLDAGLRPLRIAINVSGRQIPDDRLITHIRAALCDFRLHPEQVQFEIELTETALVAIEPSRAVLSALRDLGLTIAIDDFGTGYSSLSMLQHLPIDRIKICQDFVRGIPADNDSKTIVEAILALGRALNKNIIAEGVETEVQLAFLRDHGCNEIQGHLFGKAIRADQIAGYLGHPATPP